MRGEEEGSLEAAERRLGQVPELPGGREVGGRVEPRHSTFGADSYDSYDNAMVVGRGSPLSVTVSANPQDKIFDLPSTSLASGTREGKVVELREELVGPG